MENPIYEVAQRARKPKSQILPAIYSRWSPRAMDGKPLAKEMLMTLFEAARWAPSTYNEQEWRYLYAHNGSQHWPLFFDALMEANQAWCKNASVLLVIAGKETFTHNGKVIAVRSFDCGASLQNLALQGCSMGLVVHGMAGFYADKVRANLQIPGGYAVEAMAAIGHPAPISVLPADLQDREAPSGRKEVDEFTCEGKFKW